MTPQPPSIAYVDSSSLVPLVFGERRAGDAITWRLRQYWTLLSSNLLEAELRVAFRQAQQDFDPILLSNITWVMPDRALDAELADTLAVANLRPAQLWHLANAVYIRQRLGGLPMAFITLDEQQETVAVEFGFAV